MPKERECVTASEDVVLSVDELRMRYGTTDVLHGVTFQVRRGEVVALLGPNGAGKTTTVEILEGFRMRSAGRVEVLGTDPARGSEQWRARVGIVLQSWRDHGRWRVRELLAHLGSYYACYSTELIERPWDADELVAAVGLANCAGKKVKTLSGGQRRRLDVALGLVGRPELLFLDEPTAGFDPQARREFHDLLLRLTEQDRTTILLTTHDLGEAEKMYWLGLGMRSVLLPASAASVEIGDSWRHLQTVGVLGIWAVLGRYRPPRQALRGHPATGSCVAARRDIASERSLITL
jgi:ABC-2 type transport system ATP-binding protein